MLHVSEQKENVLFVCVHNSARSQMAEAFLRRAAGDLFEVFSAGLERGKLNADVVTVMGEIGYDISQAQTKDMASPEITSRSYRHVITVCSESQGQACPIVPTEGRREQWFFVDPSSITGPDAVRLHAIRGIRDGIKAKVEKWADARRAERGVVA